MHTVFIALRALLFMSGFVWLWYWIAMVWKHVVGFLNEELGIG